MAKYLLIHKDEEDGDEWTSSVELPSVKMALCWAASQSRHFHLPGKLTLFDTSADRAVAEYDVVFPEPIVTERLL